MTVQAVDLAVTVVGDTRAVDLVVPSTVPMADLLPQLARMVDVPSGRLGWELVPAGAAALPAEATLDGAGVVDGAVLRVRAADVRLVQPVVRSVRDRLPVPGAPSAGRWPDVAGLVMTTLLVLPAVVAVGWSLADRPVVASPSLALLFSATVLALLAGWTAVRAPVRPAGEAAPTEMARVWPSVAGVAGVGWAATAGASLVGAVAPGATGLSVAGGAAGAAVVALVVGGVWARVRARSTDAGPVGDPAAGCRALGAAAVGACALASTVVAAVPLGAAAALRLVAVLAVVGIGLLPGAVVSAAGLLRVDRQAGTTGMSATAVDAAGAGASRALSGALVGVVVVVVSALAARLPTSGPSDVLTAGAVAVVLALRARTLGRRLAVVPLVGSAAVAVTAVALASADQPADRLAAAVVGLAVMFGVAGVVAARVRPPSPTARATARRLLRGVERVVVCLVVPVAAGALQWSVLPWAGQLWPAAH